MALDVFFEVVVPLLEMETTALIAISTPLDGLNFYSEMFELKGADGKPLFNTLRVGLSCEKCQRDGKADSCSHMKDVIRKSIYLFCLQLKTNNFFSSMEVSSKVCKYLSCTNRSQTFTNSFYRTWLRRFMVTGKTCLRVNLWVRCTYFFTIRYSQIIT